MKKWVHFQPKASNFQGYSAEGGAAQVRSGDGILQKGSVSFNSRRRNLFSEIGIDQDDKQRENLGQESCMA